MKRKVYEELTLFASVVKWAVYAAGVGCLVGAGTTVFLRSLAWASSQVGRYPGYFHFLPATLAVSALLVAWLAPEAAGHGTEKVIEAVHTRMGRIALKVVPVKLVATVITLAGGGSAGKEGPCAQIGAALASSFATMLRLKDQDRRKIVICGISAGFATVFGTPIAGALFGIEVLVLGQMLYEVLFPSFVAGIVGFHVATLLGGQYPRVPVIVPPQVNGWSIFEVVALGLWCGLVAIFFIEAATWTHKSFDRVGSKTLRAALGGALMVAIGAWVSPRYLGLGIQSLDEGWRGAALPLGTFFWKSIATSVTLGCGGSGGVVTPIFVIGTGAGNLFAQLVDVRYLALFSAIGMVAVLAGAANTPIAASVMAMELFGPAIGPHAALACMVSFLIVGYRSIYPSQLLGIKKSESLPVEMGIPIGSMRRDQIALPEWRLWQKMQRRRGKGEE
ncbi:chloride channel protein [Geomesophilobacter sediminis]|uniref:Chloride channel protein n=1 Tax=Geomesophilobacter sediminis TaxID=2798584 RepID=A0A8J7SBJ9_9BACT|nr:chloride channel protein [Geomesophilobacter sediminis]MBJ6727836.1 chloride channel protein [Geomesophilobacter sediminis]